MSRIFAFAGYALRSFALWTRTTRPLDVDALVFGGRGTGAVNDADVIERQNGRILAGSYYGLTPGRRLGPQASCRHHQARADFGKRELRTRSAGKERVGGAWRSPPGL